MEPLQITVDRYAPEETYLNQEDKFKKIAYM